MKEIYNEFKRGIELKGDSKGIHKPFFIFVLKLFSDIADAAKTDKMIEDCAQSIEWDENLLKDIGIVPFIKYNIGNELRKVKQVRPSMRAGSMVPGAEDKKSCYEDLYKRIGAVNYTNLEDNPIENLPEEFTT